MWLISTLWMDSIALASNPTCPLTNLNGKGCSTVTTSSDCTSSYMPPSSTVSTGTICSWNGNSCTDGGGLAPLPQLPVTLAVQRITFSPIMVAPV